MSIYYHIILLSDFQTEASSVFDNKHIYFRVYDNDYFSHNTLIPFINVFKDVHLP